MESRLNNDVWNVSQVREENQVEYWWKTGCKMLCGCTQNGKLYLKMFSKDNILAKLVTYFQLFYYYFTIILTF